MNSKVIAAVAGCAVALGLNAAMPVIPQESVVFNQNSNSRLVTISYELQEAPAIVTVDILTNGVSIGEHNFTTIRGDVNKLVQPGVNKLIFWQPDKEWPGYKFTQGEVSVIVKGWDKGRPPDYLVVDLTTENAEPRYYVSEKALPNGGLSNREEYLKNKLVMRRIPAAGVTWKMGSPATEGGRTTDGRETQHDVTFTNDYFMAIYTVSQGQQVTAIGMNTAYPAHRTNDTMVVNNTNYNQLRGSPSESIDWPSTGHDVKADSILGKWRAKTGIDFDLPTSAQWEYACRAGSGTAFCCGLDIPAGGAVLLPALNSYAWFGGADGNSRGNIHLIGLLKPNDWGLYDMHGNMWEACLDWRTLSYDSADIIEPKGANAETYRVYRGGAYGSAASACRSASINGVVPNSNTADGQSASWHITYRLCCPVQLVW